MCMHMFTSHDVVVTIMARDGRIGMESVLAKLFPCQGGEDSRYQVRAYTS
jgi:hypothetical protein